jgi:hypothetical protein
MFTTIFQRRATDPLSGFKRGHIARRRVKMSDMTYLTAYLEKLEELSLNATEGPWSDLGEQSEIHSCVMIDSGGDPYHVAEYVHKRDDVLFIAESRQAIPILLKLVKRYREALDRYTSNPEYWDKSIDEWYAVYAKEALAYSPFDKEETAEDPRGE